MIWAQSLDYLPMSPMLYYAVGCFFPPPTASHNLNLLGSQGLTSAHGFWSCIVRCPSGTQSVQLTAPVPTNHC